MLHRLPLPIKIIQHRGADPLRLCKQPLANIQLAPAPLQRLVVVQEPESSIICNPLLKILRRQRVFSALTFLVRRRRLRLPRRQ